MIRKFLNFAAAVSLVLCCVLAAFWLIGYWRFIQIRICPTSGTPYTAMYLASEGGGVGGSIAHGSDIRDWQHFHFESRVPMRYRVWLTTRTGFDAGVDRFQASTSAAASAPGWFCVLCTAVLPAMWMLRSRRSRHKPGACHFCGYDLTGNTSGVCSECGSPIAEKAEAKA